MLRGLGGRGGLGGLGLIMVLGPGRGRWDGGGGRSAAGGGWTGWPGWAGIDRDARSRLGTPGWRSVRCGGGLPGMATSYWRVGRCWVPAADAGMAERALRWWVARDGNELLACWSLLGPGRGRRDGGVCAAVVGCQGWQRATGVLVAAGSRLGTPGWWRGDGAWVRPLARSRRGWRWLVGRGG